MNQKYLFFDKVSLVDFWGTKPFAYNIFGKTVFEMLPLQNWRSATPPSMYIGISADGKVFLVIITTKIAAKELFGSCEKRIMSIMTMRA